VQLFQLGASDAAALLAPVALVHNVSFDLVENDTAEPQEEPEEDWPAPRQPVPVTAPLRAQVLGPLRLEVAGELVKSGLRSSAYELLAWFLTRPEGATQDAAIEDLWPNCPPDKGRNYFWTALTNLRHRLGGGTEELVSKVGGHYRVNPAAIDADLWRFELALAEAAKAPDAEAATAALERAVSAYGGDFYPNCGSLWVVPVREDLHRRALDSCTRLAELHQEAGRPDAAAAALERAIGLDPIYEDAYRRLIALQNDLGRNDAAQRTYEQLKARLMDLGVEPEEDTVALVRRIHERRQAARSRR
jgi:DNA-binding SARP family transcriptional activator